MNPLTLRSDPNVSDDFKAAVPAIPGTLAYLRETVEDCIAILKRDNDAADAEAVAKVSGAA